MFKNLQNIASFVQLQFKCMNICLFLLKLPILVKISDTNIEMLILDKWSSKLYRFQKRKFQSIRSYV